MLIRKMLRDMTLNKTQFISIFLLTVLGVFIYSGVSSEWNGLRRTADDFYSETNLADAWVYGMDFSNEAAEAVGKIEGVTGTERRLTLSGIGKFDNDPTIKLHFVESNQISMNRLIAGEEFTAEKDGIWLDSLFAKAKGLEVGDKLTVNINGYNLEKQIKGLVMSPEYVYSAGDDFITTHNTFGYAFLSYLAYPKELPFVYSELLITLESPADDALENDIDTALNGRYSVFLPRKNMRSYMQFNEEIKEHKAMGEIFPVLFLAVAVLTIVTTMTRLVNNQRTQIGILKAIGFKHRRILWHYVSYGLWLSLTGTMIGAVVGPLTLPYLFYGPMQTAYILPEWKAAVPLSVIFVAFVAVLMCTLVTLFACRNVLKDTPSESMRPKAPKDIRHSVIDRFGFWRKLSFDTQWNLRDVFRCKGRSMMAITGVLGCTALLICAFGMQDTFDYVKEWNYKVLNRYETRFELEKAVTQEQIDQMTKEYYGVGIFESAVELKANEMKRSGELLVSDPTPLLQFVDKDSKLIELPKDSLSISYKIAKQLGVAVGDQVSWHIYGEEKWNISTIGAIYRTPFTQGITLPKEYYEEYGYRFTPSAILSGEVINQDVKESGISGASKIQTKQTLIESFNNLAQAMDLLIYVLMLAAAVLAVVVIYNLGVLAFTERQREMSTLKVIGFKTGKLRNLLLTQNIWLTIVGIIPGIPIGIWIMSYIFRFVGDVFDFILVVNLSSYLYCILGTCILSILVNRFFSRRVKDIDMVSSLKGVE